MAASDAGLQSGAGRITTRDAGQGHQVPPVTPEVVSWGHGVRPGTGSSLGDYENHEKDCHGPWAQHLGNADEVMGDRGTGSCC